ncbi:hypothetical protein CLOM_g1815, partial [Closterium sp. NIES-68]
LRPTAGTIPRLSADQSPTPFRRRSRQPFPSACSILRRIKAGRPPASSFPPSPSANGPENGSASFPPPAPGISAKDVYRSPANYGRAEFSAASSSNSLAAPLPPAIASPESSAAPHFSTSHSAGDSAGSYEGFPAPPSALPPLREFTSAELQAATGGFARAIGEGGFGKVFQGRMMLPAGESCATGASSSATGGEMRECEVAVKVMNGKHVTRDLTSFKAEVAALSAVNHPNILRLEGVALDTAQGPVLVYELISGGDVKCFLKRVRQGEVHFPWRDRIRVALGCAEALAAIHTRNLVHRDFKSSNVLLREDLTPVVADFGLARTIDDWKTHVSTKVVGSMGYIDPIYFQTGQLSQKSDTFAFGVFLLELMSGCCPLSAQYQELRQLIISKDLPDPLLVMDPAIEGEWARKPVLIAFTLVRYAICCNWKQRPPMSVMVSKLQSIFDEIETSC